MRRWMIIILLALIFAALAMYCARRNSGITSLTKPPEDKVQLSGGTGGHSAAILLDGRRSSCFGDEIVRTTQTAVVNSILAPSGCDSRVAAFVQDKAMYYGDPAAWTDGSDTLQVPLAPMPQLPISIWVPLLPPPSGRTEGEGVLTAIAHIDAARPIYNNMQCGIGFEDAVPIQEKRALNSISAGCSNLGPVKAVGYTPGRLNVYYVQEITDASGAIGIHCAADPTVILIDAMFGVNATLSHEAGHALSLDHTNYIDGLNDPVPTGNGDFVTNLMLQSGYNQALLSTGQCFRCNLNSSSAINTLGARTGPTPGCHAVNSTAECPELSFDVVPK